MATAWIITEDLIADEDAPIGSYSNAVGVTGPRSAPEHLIEALKAGKGLQFKMYDDDGEHYYTGRGIADKYDLGSEEFAYGPLGNFGMPNAGCTLIKWTNHPEWNCG